MNTNLNNNQANIMIDLETLGTKPGCIILSIGACSFGDISTPKKTFYSTIDISSSQLAGLTSDHNTVSWWDKQDPEIKKEAFSGTEPLYEVLHNFSDWLSSFNKEVILWGNGIDFDIPILGAAYELSRITVPWEYYNSRCYRTLKNLFPDFKQPTPPRKHNALSDAITQALHAELLLRRLEWAEKLAKRSEPLTGSQVVINTNVQSTIPPLGYAACQDVTILSSELDHSECIVQSTAQASPDWKPED